VHSWRGRPSIHELCGCGEQGLRQYMHHFHAYMHGRQLVAPPAPVAGSQCLKGSGRKQDGSDEAWGKCSLHVSVHELCAAYVTVI
jgi:hypothetical protein